MRTLPVANAASKAKLPLDTATGHNSQSFLPLRLLPSAKSTAPDKGGKALLRLFASHGRTS